MSLRCSSYDCNNIFAKILRGEIPCDKVYEDDYALAFNDISPSAPVHVLVIPKGQYQNISDFSTNASAQEISGFWRAVAKVAEDKNLLERGYRIISNEGQDGGQEVPHFHVHVLGGKVLGKLVA